MRVAGLDLSLTSTGLVVLEPDRVIDSVAIKSKHKDEARLVNIGEQLHFKLVEHYPNLVVLEGYAFMANGRITGLAELAGVIKTNLYMHSQKFIIVPPARVKKFACGKGNAKKDEVRLEVFKRWGFEAKTNDEVDAYVLAKIGLAYLGEPTQNKAQAEVIADLRKSYEVVA